MENHTVKKILIIELNEFNVELLETASKKLHLPTISRLLKFKKYKYVSEDKVESYDGGRLEPWIQWASIHTNISSSQHKVKNLGEVPDSAIKQFWEVMGDHNLTTGVWGIMSGRKPDAWAKNVVFFLPDPWTVSEAATPKELNDFLDLPRYMASNYLYISPRLILAKGWKFTRTIFNARLAGKIFFELLRLVPAFLRFGSQYFLFSLFFDFISTQLFLRYKRKHQPDCCIFFINSMAHIQHHHWTEEKGKITPPMSFGLKYLDRLLSELLIGKTDNETVILHNGLSQKNMANETPWFLYRQKNPVNFITNIGLGPNLVEQLMTHDAHVIFRTEAECDHAFNVLSVSKLGSENIFHVERSKNSGNRLFYRVNITSLVKGNPEVSIGENKFRFYALFDKVVQRTGTHIPTGTIYSEDVEFDDAIPNHEFNHFIYRYLNLDI